MPEDGLILSEIAILSGDYFVIMRNMYSNCTVYMCECLFLLVMSLHFVFYNFVLCTFWCHCQISAAVRVNN